ncbi:MAG: Uma2 family endonuclease [Fimbriimonas sp.]
MDETFKFKERRFLAASIAIAFAIGHLFWVIGLPDFPRFLISALVAVVSARCELLLSEHGVSGPFLIQSKQLRIAGTVLLYACLALAQYWHSWVGIPLAVPYALLAFMAVRRLYLGSVDYGLKIEPQSGHRTITSLDNLATRKWTLEDYRAQEETSAIRHEFYGGQIYPMTGASPRHNDIKGNISGTLFSLLRGSACRGRSSDMRVKIEATGFHTYPDYLIICGEGEYPPDDPNSLLNPIVIFEIFSPATEEHDRTFKMDQYRLIPGLRKYILVSQDEVRVEVYEPNNIGWSPVTYAQSTGKIDLGIEGITIQVSDIDNEIEH